MSAPILNVQDLRKSYGETHAVRGVSFSVARGCWRLDEQAT
jgi:ABC-type branched-subunit amino acid transport system ATPase component